MSNQNNIQDELRGMNSKLPDQNSHGPFSVPDGYFEGLAASILAKVKEQPSSAADELQELSPYLAQLPKKLPYTVPDGYFEENMAGLSFVFATEDSAVLNAVGKDLPYTVPADYFATLPQAITAKVARPTAKVVPLFARGWMRAAVAAVIGGVMILGGYRLLNSSASEEPVANVAPPADTTQTLVAKTEKPLVSQDLKTASTADLDNFIQSVPLNLDKLQKKTTSAATKESKVKDLLKNVSVNEMDDFLEQIPTGDDELFVID